MTNAQIHYRQHRETVRHDKEQEANWQKQLDESIRHSKEQERLTQYGADTQAATSRYVAETSAAASRYGAETSAAASRYVGEQRAEATKYSADVGANTAQKRLDFDKLVFDFQKYSQTYQNTLAGFRYNLDKMLADSNVKLNSAKISQISREILNSITELAQKAEQLGLNEVRVAAQNALDRARTWEAYSKTAMNSQQIIRTILNDVDNVLGKRLSDKISSVIDKLLPKQDTTTSSPTDYNVPIDWYTTIPEDTQYQRPTGGSK